MTFVLNNLDIVLDLLTETGMLVSYHKHAQSHLLHLTCNIIECCLHSQCTDIEKCFIGICVIDLYALPSLLNS